MKNKVNSVRTKLIIQTNKEILSDSSVTMINSMTMKKHMDFYEEIVIQLQDEYFKSDNKRVLYYSPQNKNKTHCWKNRQVKTFDTNFKIKKLHINTNIVKNISYFDIGVSSDKKEQQNEEDLINVYNKFLGCLESKRSIGFEKHMNFQEKLNLQLKLKSMKSSESHTTKKSFNSNGNYFKFKEITSTYPVNKIETVMNFLNRGNEYENEIEKKKRIKRGIFYLQSLIYCLMKTNSNLQKSKKNKEEFNDFRKELLSPLLNMRKSTNIVSFEALKKVFIWKEEEKERRESKKKFSIIGIDLNNTIKMKTKSTFNSNEKPNQKLSKSMNFNKFDFEQREDTENNSFSLKSTINSGKSLNAIQINTQLNGLKSKFVTEDCPNPNQKVNIRLDYDCKIERNEQIKKKRNSSISSLSIEVDNDLNIEISGDEMDPHEKNKIKNNCFQNEKLVKNPLKTPQKKNSNKNFKTQYLNTSYCHSNMSSVISFDDSLE